MVIVLAVLLFVAVQLLFEAKQLPSYLHYIAYTVIVVGLVWYWFRLMPEEEMLSLMGSVQYGAAVLLAFFAVFLAPTLQQHVRQSMRLYSINLFTRLMLGFLLAAAVWIGCIVVTLAVSFFFEIQLSKNVTFQLWIICATLVGPWIFLARLPQWHSKIWQDQLQSKLVFPNVVLKCIAYLLLPLSAILLTILYCYFFKILFTWQWPKDGVTGWIIGISTYALVVWLLHPKFSRLLFSALIPVSLVHSGAIAVRIMAYGSTASRYAVAMFGLWLLVTAIYYLVQWKKSSNTSVNLLYLPLSLVVLIIVGVYSPVNAFTVSRWNQVYLAETTLREAGLLVYGAIQHPDIQLSAETCGQLASQIKYLYTTVPEGDLPVWLQSTIRTVRINGRYVDGFSLRRAVLQDHCKKYAH